MSESKVRREGKKKNHTQATSRTGQWRKQRKGLKIKTSQEQSYVVLWRISRRGCCKWGWSQMKGSGPCWPSGRTLRWNCSRLKNPVRRDRRKSCGKTLAFTRYVLAFAAFGKKPQAGVEVRWTVIGNTLVFYVIDTAGGLREQAVEANIWHASVCLITKTTWKKKMWRRICCSLIRIHEITNWIDWYEFIVILNSRFLN